MKRPAGLPFMNTEEGRSGGAGGLPHNFSAGPGAFPSGVLEEAGAAMRMVPEAGLPLLGISHRSRWFREVLDEAEEHVGALLGLGAGWKVLFLQGGATQQFSQIPMSFLGGGAADYLLTGYWSKKAVAEARKAGRVNVVWDGEGEGFARMPDDGEMRFEGDAAYFHYVSNETVEGVQFHRVPGAEGVVRCCDMSSDFLSRPLDMERFGLVYAHAQKNLGPSGVTVVVMREDLLERVPEGLPAALDYRLHAAAGSIYNTPPVFAIYVTMLVARWLRREIGGLEAMGRINEGKQAMIYEAVDASGGFYRARVRERDRSWMNVTFTLPDAETERRFFAEARAEGITGIEGHRAVGGVRVSLYNAVTVESARVLAEFMREFYRRGA